MGFDFFLEDFGGGGISRRQYEKLRIPISMLRIRRGLALADERVLPGEVICGSSSCRRWMRRDLVPEVDMPHLKAISCSALALSVLGIVIAIHDLL